MSKWYCLVVVSVLAVACTANAEMDNQAPIGPQKIRMQSNSDNGVRFIMELVPVSFLFSPDLDGFNAHSHNYHGYSYYEVTIDGTGSWIPSGRLGISIGTGPVFLDITGGAGYLWNNAFSGPFLVGDFAARFKIGDHWTIGPHAGLLSFNNMTWDGGDTYGDTDTDTKGEFELSDTTGWMAGVVTTFGGKHVSGFLSVDYLSAKMDVSADPAVWTLSEDTIDLSGLAIQAGIVFRF